MTGNRKGVDGVYALVSFRQSSATAYRYTICSAVMPASLVLLVSYNMRPEDGRHNRSIARYRRREQEFMATSGRGAGGVVVLTG